jgi:hypothetical protein
MKHHASLRSASLGTIVLLSLASAACRGGSSSDGEGGAGGSSGTGLSDATSLACPFPGALPFAVEATAFDNADNQLTVDGSPRSKDAAADALGNPGGVFANTYVAADGASLTGSIRYQGRKARTGQNSGLTSVPIFGEAVSLWTYDVATETWLSLGRSTTDADGRYDIAPSGATISIGQPVYAVLEADQSCAAHYDFLEPAGRKTIITDIDGTLTLSDEELFKQIDDGTYDPLENASASALMNLWADKGYQIVYLTARPHDFRAETRAWLEERDFPLGPVITANTLVFDETARQYKRSWVNRVRTDFGWDVVAAYGNATSDIDAYEDGGIPKDVTFIVGPNAGANGTQSIENNDYGDHITDFVSQQPDA